MTFDKKDLDFTVVPLLPELELYICDGPMGRCLKHPLVFEIMLVPEMHGIINKRFEYIKKAAREAKENKQWGSYIARHERAYRWEALLEVASEMTPKEYWETVSWVWTDSENIWQYQKFLNKIFFKIKDEQNRMEWLMDESEKACLNAKPDFINIFRGVQKIRGKWFNQKGWSWSSDPEKAKFFATRYARKDSQKFVLESVVEKKNIIACFLGRNESEIVVNPKNIKIISKTEVGK